MYVYSIEGVPHPLHDNMLLLTKKTEKVFQHYIHEALGTRFASFAT